MTPFNPSPPRTVTISITPQQEKLIRSGEVNPNDYFSLGLIHQLLKAMERSLKTSDIPEKDKDLLEL